MSENEIDLERDQELLQSAALEIFINLSAGPMRAFDRDAVARRAFAYARSFVAEAQRIADGGVIETPPREVASPRVIVHLWDPVSGQRMFHEDTGLPVLLSMMGDHNSHAPNLDPEHPTNQRYYRALQALKLPVPDRYAEAAAKPIPQGVPVASGRN